jgi:hypothetical protein
MRRNLCRLLFALCAFVLHGADAAGTSEFQISPRAGFGSLKVDGLVGINRERINRDTSVAGPASAISRRSASSPRLARTASATSTSGTRSTASGSRNQFDLGNRWRLVPRVGHAWWKLRTEEGRIFNPGPEATRTVHGESFFWEIGVARQISRVVTLGAAFRQGQYDFGRTQSATFTVTLGF